MDKSKLESRRAFVVRAGRAAVVAPAAALLINASAQKAKAIDISYQVVVIEDRIP